MADIYIQNGKYDMAIELLKKVLMYNKVNIDSIDFLTTHREANNFVDSRPQSQT